MLKFLIISIIFIYVVYKVSGFLLKIFYPIQNARRAQAEFERQRDFGPEYRRQQKQQPPNGNIYVDHVPEERKKSRTTEDFKGGEYVDFEEVK